MSLSVVSMDGGIARAWSVSVNDRRMILEARNVGRMTSDQRGWLFRDVSLSISAGERVALVGPSGSGKTVLLRALVLLDPWDTGQLLWEGRDVGRYAVPHYRSQVIYLHQRPAIIEGTVAENLEYPFRFAVHRNRAFDSDKVEYWLGILGRDLSFLAKHSRDLSGGEMQIAALLRAVQLEPQILMLDEPTSALDQATTEAVEHCVQQWHREGGAERSFVVVSHNTEQVRRMVDRTLSIQDGQLREDEAWD